ncbi:MAG TPA: enoyl-CoA hydratase-related protein [Dehalococcoidia bacterium]|nr:enoyl-CoA hydratase-related protein [Dehalococcoidia bacterium]
MPYRDLQVELDGGVCWLTLDRPEQMNALTPEMGDGLVAALDQAARDDEVRAVVITGAGRAFCAGGDLKTMNVRAERERTAGGRLEALNAAGRRIPVLLRQVQKPVIAAVNGAAMGWGCDLAVACDIRVAAEGARFGELFVKRGLIPDGGATYNLPRLIGMDRAAELIFTGRMVDAAEALRIGLVTRVVPAAELQAETRRLAAEIAANAPLAVQTAKRLLYAQQQLTIEQAMEQVTFFLSTLRQSEDHHEGVAAFLEKREAVFRGV